ncbi:unnamed protein product [Prorocentrum cordatum]|uniref:Pyridoxamine 5'-phosphate oxidase putative domain-containing protein n=1 Tax=Prorocentrum cordatum TaxID=2364126 RepID=A0ABN9TAH4_9DINO|nr:unnamed protein product [Polarella glacialis]CAK0876891.1 unnamed protein product [Polarella glacialis]
MSDLSAVLPQMHAWLSANAPAVLFGLFTTRFPNFKKKQLQSHFSFVDRAGILYISSEGTAGNDAGGAAVLTSLSGSEIAAQRELQTWDTRFSVGGLVHVDLDRDVRLAKVIECRGVSMDLFVLANEVLAPDIPLCAIRQLPEQLAADALAKAHGKDVRFGGSFRYGDFVEVRWPEHGIYVPRSSAAIVADARKRS